MSYSLLLLFSFSSPILTNLVHYPMLPKVMAQFTDYATYLYYDNVTIRQVESNSSHLGQYLLNCDLKPPGVTYRPSGFRNLHVILLENVFEMENCFTVGVKFKDVVLIFIKNHLTSDQLMDVCKIKGLDGAGGVFIMGSNSSVFHCCYYCGKEKVSLNEIRRRGGKIPLLNRFVNNFTNFHGYSFKIGFAEYLPFFYCRYNENHECEQYLGAEWHLLEALSESLNFNFRLVEYFGDENSTSWATMIKEVQDGNIDWVLSGVYHTSERSQMVDFTRYVKVETYATLYEPHEDRWLTAINLLHSVYGYSKAIFVGVAITAFVLATIAKFSLKMFRGIDRSLLRIFLETLLYVAEQPSQRLQRLIRLCKPYVKYIFLPWWILCVCLTTYYKSLLASLLLATSKVPSDTEDIIDQGFEFQIHVDQFYYVQFVCENTTNKACEKLLEATVSMDLCDSIRTALNNKTGFVGDELLLQFAALKRCNLTLDQKYSLETLTAKVIGYYWRSYPMKRCAPFVHTFSGIIAKLEATGLLQYWFRRYLGRYSNLRDSPTVLHEVVLRRLGLQDLIFPFSVFIFGNAIATIIFLLEILDANCRPLCQCKRVKKKLKRKYRKKV